MAQDPGRPDEIAADDAHQQVLHAIDDAIAATGAVTDLDRRYAAAKRLVESLRQATITGGQLHAQTAALIHEKRPMPYSALGRLLGVGKTRAEQLVRQGRASQQDAT